MTDHPQNDQFHASSFLQGANAEYVEQMYARFAADPQAVDRTWAEPGLYTVTCTAYNADHPAGVSASTNLLVLPLAAPALTPGTFANGAFSFMFPTQPAVNYSVYYATSLTPPVTWTFLGGAYGDGNPASVVDSAATSATRFYRVRVW